MDNHFENKRMVEQARKINKERKEAYYKRTLATNIKRKFTTTMIGALSTFETYFGELWGHGKPENERTEQEEEFAKLWESVRTEILNKGNNEKRAAEEELARYTVNYDGYKMNLLVKKDSKENE